MISPRRKKPLKLKQVNNIWLKLVDLEDRKRIYKLLGYWNVRWVNNQRKANWISMVGKSGFLFAGFLPYLEERFRVEVEIKEEKKLPSEPFLTGQDIRLRDYQESAIRQALRKRRGQISMPTGTGKTVVAAGILSSMPEAKSLFVVHTKDLLDQTIEEFGYLLGKNNIGFVGEGNSFWRQRTVGMIQSLRNYSFKTNPVDIVIVDEGHHVPAPTYISLLKKIDCPIRLSLTGTTREDDKGFVKSLGILGPVIYEYTYQEAVRDGWLSQAIIRMLKLPSRVFQSNKYRKVYDELIIDNEERNKFIVDESLAFARQGKTVLVQVKEVRHGRILKEMFSDAAEFIYSGTTREQRLTVKELLKIKHKLIVIASPIWDEGVDIPDLSSIVVAGGGKSPIKSIQKVGRGLRKTKEKDLVEVIDFYDNSHKYLRSHSRERIKHYESKGWIVKKEF